MKIVAKKISFLLLSIIVTIGALELLVRVVSPQQLIVLRPDIWKPDAELGHRHRENADTVVNVGEGLVHFVTDSSGYRISAHKPESRPLSALSILTIGDSMLEGLQMDSEYTIPEVIRKYLQAKYNQPVQVDNAGVAAWGPNHYYFETTRALRQQNYDLGIVFLYVGNDITSEEVTSYPPRQHAERHRFRVPRSLERKELINAIFYPINDLLETQSQLFIYLKTRLRVQLAKLGLTPLYFPSIFKTEEAASDIWDTTARVCEKIEREFSRHGTSVFFVLLPTIYQVHDDMFEEYIASFRINPETVDLAQPNMLLKRHFEAKGLILVDPLKYMRGKAENGHRMYGSVDTTHLNANGHEIVAEYILPMVESHYLRFVHERAQGAGLRQKAVAQKTIAHHIRSIVK